MSFCALWNISKAPCFQKKPFCVTHVGWMQLTSIWCEKWLMQILLIFKHCSESQKSNHLIKVVVFKGWCIKKTNKPSTFKVPSESTLQKEQLKNNQKLARKLLTWRRIKTVWNLEGQKKHLLVVLYPWGRHRHGEKKNRHKQLPVFCYSLKQNKSLNMEIGVFFDVTLQNVYLHIFSRL